MSGRIRKLTISYPILVEGRQQMSVFSVEDKKVKVAGFVINSIREILNHEGKLTYQINIERSGTAKVWKQITPANCTVEIEYFIE